MTIEEVISVLEEWAPKSWAEDFDNTGLLVGNSQNEVTGVLVALDSTEEVVQEAVSRGCNLIISFHPIVFSGLKNLTGKDYVQRAVMLAIKQDIAIYAIHTSLDNHFDGVNARICQTLNLQNREILIPRAKQLKKLTTYIPKEKATVVRDALFNAGAGSIGNYDQCSFASEGFGSFRGNADSNPVYGDKGTFHLESETQLGVLYENSKEKQVLQALFRSHPYEEVAYEIHTLDNTYQKIGMGMVGNLMKPMKEVEFLTYIKKQMGAEIIKHSPFTGQLIERVAVLGGSGAFAIQAAIQSGAQAFVTADLKYHDFFKAEGKLLLADIGHYESEQFTKNLIVEYLTEKFTNFAIVLAVCNTNPVKYF